MKFKNEQVKSGVFKDVGKLLKYVIKKDIELRANEFDRLNSIKLKHSDGSKIKVTNFLLEECYVIFASRIRRVYNIYTEHHGYFIYFAEDIKSKIKIQKR